MNSYITAYDLQKKINECRIILNAYAIQNNLNDSDMMIIGKTFYNYTDLDMSTQKGFYVKHRHNLATYIQIKLDSLLSDITTRQKLLFLINDKKEYGCLTAYGSSFNMVMLALLETYYTSCVSFNSWRDLYKLDISIASQYTFHYE